MSAVIREAGVSSGSLYYRFPDRSALLGALWNRAIDSYHHDAYALFAGDPIEAAAALAAYTVRWCMADPPQAHVLLTGHAQLEVDAWPEAARQEREAEHSRWNHAVRDLVHRLGTATSAGTAELLLLVVDLPYAAVRRYIGDGRAIPQDLPDLVARIVRTSLA